MSYNELKQHGTEDFPIELYHIEQGHTRYEMSAHWHNEIEIIRVLDGVLNIRLNNNFYSVKKGEIIFINPETVHQASPENCVYECVVFHLDFISAQHGRSLPFIDSLRNHESMVDEYHTDAHSAFARAVHALFDEMASENAGREFKVLGAIYRIFGEILDSDLCKTTSSAPLGDKRNVPKLREVLYYIRNNYDSAITLNDMASMAGMSPKYFCYFFKEMTTKTPVEYLNAYRIEKASRKLTNSDLSVTDIAFSCGFNDLSYFIKTFKKHKGITPAKYRKDAFSAGRA